MAIKQGSTGSDVAALQKKLNSLGYGLSEDGIYGSKTAAAVRDYQSKNGLSVDGIVGSQTTASLYGGGSSGTGNVSSSTSTTTKKTYSPYYDVEDYEPSSRVTDYEDRLSDYEDDYEPYTPSQKVTDYENKVKEYEESEPDAFTSKYDATINEILDTIKNKGSFDLSTDANYQQLYDNYKESYTNSAKKAMRDTLASANASTGGYGSTYGQAVAQQAYDSQMEGLNDQNLNLMQMAYQMYGDDVANDYNKLSAYQGQDAVDYNRYRDTYNDWYNNRNYYANQYQNAYNNDYGQYRDSASDYYNTRSYLANMYQNAYTNDYGQYRDRVSDARNAYQDMESTYANAMSYASQGYELPSYLKEQLGDDDLSYFENVAAQAQLAATQAASAGSRGSSGSGSGKGSGTGTQKSAEYKDALSKAGKFTTPEDVEAFVNDYANEGWISYDEAADIYKRVCIDNRWNLNDALGYGDTNSYSEHVAVTKGEGYGPKDTNGAVTGDSAILTEGEFKQAVATGSSRAHGYTNYQDYLKYMRSTLAERSSKWSKGEY